MVFHWLEQSDFFLKLVELAQASKQASLLIFSFFYFPVFTQTLLLRDLYLPICLSICVWFIFPPLPLISASLISLFLSSQAETIRPALPFLAEVHSPNEAGKMLRPHALLPHTGKKPSLPAISGKKRMLTKGQDSTPSDNQMWNWHFLSIRNVFVCQHSAYGNISKTPNCPAWLVFNKAQ